MVMEGFEEIVPGVSVNTKRGWKIEIPHPDPGWVIRNKDETLSIGNRENLYVFSSEELANKYMEKTHLSGGFPKSFSWDECVDKFGKSYSNVLVDPTGEPGFLSSVPLRKGI
jgi:hypothetical protein